MPGAPAAGHSSAVARLRSAANPTTGRVAQFFQSAFDQRGQRFELLVATAEWVREAGKRSPTPLQLLLTARWISGTAERWRSTWMPER
jgi:hypothetical protein